MQSILEPFHAAVNWVHYWIIWPILRWTLVAKVMARRTWRRASTFRALEQPKWVAMLVWLLYLVLGLAVGWASAVALIILVVAFCWTTFTIRHAARSRRIEYSRGLQHIQVRTTSSPAFENLPPSTATTTTSDNPSLPAQVWTPVLIGTRRELQVSPLAFSTPVTPGPTEPEASAPEATAVESRPTSRAASSVADETGHSSPAPASPSMGSVSPCTPMPGVPGTAERFPVIYDSRRNSAHLPAALRALVDTELDEDVLATVTRHHQLREGLPVNTIYSPEALQIVALSQARMRAPAESPDAVAAPSPGFEEDASDEAATTASATELSDLIESAVGRDDEAAVAAPSPARSQRQRASPTRRRSSTASAGLAERLQSQSALHQTQWRGRRRSIASIVPSINMGGVRTSPARSPTAAYTSALTRAMELELGEAVHPLTGMRLKRNNVRRALRRTHSTLVHSSQQLDEPATLHQGVHLAELDGTPVAQRRARSGSLYAGGVRRGDGRRAMQLTRKGNAAAGPAASKDANDGADSCAICINSLRAPCGACEAKRAPPSACRITQGACKHRFHQHCIIPWLERCDKDGRTPTCPLDQQPFAFDKAQAVDALMLR